MQYRCASRLPRVDRPTSRMPSTSKDKPRRKAKEPATAKAKPATKNTGAKENSKKKTTKKTTAARKSVPKVEKRQPGDGDDSECDDEGEAQPKAKIKKTTMSSKGKRKQLSDGDGDDSEHGDDEEPSNDEEPVDDEGPDDGEESGDDYEPGDDAKPVKKRRKVDEDEYHDQASSESTDGEFINSDHEQPAGKSKLTTRSQGRAKPQTQKKRIKKNQESTAPDEPKTGNKGKALKPGPKPTKKQKDTVVPLDLIHPVLANAWKVNRKMERKGKIHFIFDAAPPYVEYKRGQIFDPADDFPDRAAETPSDLTDSQGPDDVDSDGNPIEWMSYKPRSHLYVLASSHGADVFISCHRAFSKWAIAIPPMEPAEFLNWDMGELRLFRMCQGTIGGSSWTDREILAPYDHILALLHAEIALGLSFDAHEPRRRQLYARQIIDLFCDEVEKSKEPPSRFYSKVLTPLLMRWLWGLYDASSKTVHAVVAQGERKATIEHATAFYLGMNPVDPKHIATYRRHLLNLPNIRWFLACAVLGIRFIGGPSGHDYYTSIHDNHDVIMTSLTSRLNTYQDLDEAGIPMLNLTEAAVIVAEGLDDYFAPELRLLVGTLPSGS
jgi:hypothetical protein